MSSAAALPSARLRVREVFGLDPLVPALRGCLLALRGDERMPATRWGVSSLAILKPHISLPTWLGRRRADRRIPIYNLPNRVPAPRDRGYSVRVTHARDFRGGRLTYDGHIGTDFAVPVGTRVVAPAAGHVCRVSNEMQRGGLKVGVDHGDGLITVSCHLSRVLVELGERVERGQVIGLSGMSGVDGILFFPWLSPHVHFNVLLDGEPADPFATFGETALWRTGNQPVAAASAPAAAPAPAPRSRFDAAAVAEQIALCDDPGLRQHLATTADPYRRGIELVFARIFWGPQFRDVVPLDADGHPRSPRIDLPFAADEWDGIVFP
jgi:murein DD-endopeptidase